jgi:hypothetical protein
VAFRSFLEPHGLTEEGPGDESAKTVQALIVRWEALSSIASPVDRSRETLREVMESYE